MLIAALPHTRTEDGTRLTMLVWRLPEPMTVASTASVGGGVGTRRWLINAQVGSNYRRVDQAKHGKALAKSARLDGSGVVMFTAAEVRRVRLAVDGGVQAEATVGLTHPTWAADADGAHNGAHDDVPGTINIVAFLPVRLAPAALLNALCTVTEAKAQALFEAGVSGTGTASDALAIACPAAGDVEPFAGPRSVWGARLARAVHAAVLAGARG
jgi:adenosylcobinamide amidohydrolase